MHFNISYGHSKIAYFAVESDYTTIERLAIVNKEDLKVADDQTD